MGTKKLLVSLIYSIKSIAWSDQLCLTHNQELCKYYSPLAVIDILYDLNLPKRRNVMDETDTLMK